MAMAVRMTFLGLSFKVLLALAFSKTTQERTFWQNPSLADVIFTENLVFRATARSHLDCMGLCTISACCKSYTYIRENSTLNTGVPCRGHSTIVSAHTSSLSAPGARTYYKFQVKNRVRRNVAVGKPAVQISTFDAKTPASKAVDNNTNSNYYAYSCAVTHANNQGTWWQVDLGQPYDVTSVVITNRGDCCGDRLHDFDVNVYTENPVTTPTAMATMCHHYSGPMAGGVTEDLACGCDVVTGRYVRVNNAPSAHLQLCEVQVFALVAP